MDFPVQNLCKTTIKEEYKLCRLLLNIGGNCAIRRNRWLNTERQTDRISYKGAPLLIIHAISKR